VKWTRKNAAETTKEWTVVIAMADGNAIGTLDAFAVHGRERPIASRFKSRSFYARTPREGSGQFQPKKRIYRVTPARPLTTPARYA
jgi:hypothetical protein